VDDELDEEFGQFGPEYRPAQTTLRNGELITAPNAWKEERKWFRDSEIWDDILVKMDADASTQNIARYILRATNRDRTKPILITARVAATRGLHRLARDRAIKNLETWGLIRVERREGRRGGLWITVVPEGLGISR
jgi:hypothetical protein